MAVETFFLTVDGRRAGQNDAVGFSVHVVDRDRNPRSVMVLQDVA